MPDAREACLCGACTTRTCLINIIQECCTLPSEQLAQREPAAAADLPDRQTRDVAAFFIDTLPVSGFTVSTMSSSSSSCCCCCCCCLVFSRTLSTSSSVLLCKERVKGSSPGAGACELLLCEALCCSLLLACKPQLDDHHRCSARPPARRAMYLCETRLPLVLLKGVKEVLHRNGKNFVWHWNSDTYHPRPSVS